MYINMNKDSRTILLIIIMMIISVVIIDYRILTLRQFSSSQTLRRIPGGPPAQLPSMKSDLWPSHLDVALGKGQFFFFWEGR